MYGVIVVHADRSRSTCPIRDAYSRDHCLRYRHNFALFYQLLDSNLFTHRNTYAILREATSETYGPRSLSYYIASLLLSYLIYYFAIFTFQSILFWNLYFQSI